MNNIYKDNIIINITMSEEYINYKYTESYFANNYNKTNNIIRRRDTSNVENQFEKGRCLAQCLKYFANIDVTTITDLSEHFECIGKSPYFETRCCCSQQEQELNSYIIVHKPTQLSFVIGKVCFTNLFNNVPPEQFNKFYQPTCDFCEQKIKVYNKNRPNFCNQKCVKKHCEQEYMKEQQLRLKKWEEEAPQREAERQAQRLKKWEEEAPLREAATKKLEEEYKRITEANQKYIESQQSKNKKIVYRHCLGCNIPKVCENNQKWPLCFKCNEKKKSLDNRL